MIQVFDTHEVKDDQITNLTNVELADRLEQHVLSRSGPRIDNGVWLLMLEAAKRLKIYING